MKTKERLCTKIALSIFFLLVLCRTAGAQDSRKATLSASNAGSCTATSTACLVIDIPSGSGGATFNIGANASANTIQFEASADYGSTWVALNVVPSNATTAVTSTTSTGAWQANVAGYTKVRMRCSTFVGGTTDTYINLSTASASARAGGGGLPNGTTVSGSDITFPGATNTSKIDNIVYVDGTTYPRTAAGINAAIVAAGNNGKVIVTPGNYTITAQILERGQNITVDGYGAVLTCNVAANCVKLDANGLGANAKQIFRGFTILPGTGSGGTGIGDGFSAIQDAGQHATIQDIGFCINGSNKFDHGVEVDNDQNATISDLDMAACGQNAPGVITATSTFVGSAIWNPGPFATNAAVGHIYNGNLSMACSGNGIDWQGANTVEVVNTVIQSFSQFTFRYNALGGPNSAGAVEHNDYKEVGNCNNPFGNIGFADSIMQGGYLIEEDGLPGGGGFPNFTTNGTPGSTLYHYWVVATNAGAAKTVPLAAGYTNTGNATISGTNSINVVWPKITSAATYDLLRVAVSINADQQAPNGTANYAVTTGYLQATCGTNVCTFIDTVPTASLASYAVPSNANFNAFLNFWPGTHVLTIDSTTHEGNGAYNAKFVGNASIGVADVSVAGATSSIRSVQYLLGSYTYSNNPQPYSPIADSSIGTYNPNLSYFNALLLPCQVDFGAGPNNIKGCLNVGNKNPWQTNTDILTLIDNNYQQTFSTMSHRPTSDTNDAAICQDNSGNGLCWRAQVSLSSYLNANPDNTSWYERLTTTLKSFTVPISGIGLLCTQHAALGHATANTITDECPAAVTAYENVKPGTAASGIILNSNVANVETQSFSGDSNHSVHVTAQTATKTIYTLCPATAGGCNVAGQYRVTWYFNQGGTACGTPTPGQVTFALSWTDNAGAHSAIALPMNDNSSIAVFTSAFKFAASNTTGFASGEFNLWSTGAQPIQVTNTYTACGVGTGTWELTAAVEQIQ